MKSNRILPPSGGRHHGGFTLVEMLIAIVITGVLGAAVMSLLLSQNRFYGKNDDVIYAQQSLRAAVDLMSAELRMASPGDLLAATPDSVSFRFDVLRAVVCDSTGADEATLFVYDSVSNANLVTGFSGTAYSGPYDSAFVYADGWTGVVGSTGATPKATCTGLGAPATSADVYYRTVTGWQGNFAQGVPDRGSLVREYGRLTYRFASSGFGTGQALWRGSQELVSPFQNGAAFSYVMADSTVQSTVAVAAFPNVRSVRVTAVALGDQANRFNVQRSIQYDIPLRN
ncbi:MAG: PilW family protein [Gemmatimonadota bacterium]